MKPHRIVLIDSYRLVLRGLHATLDPDPDFEIVGEATTAAEGLRLVREQQPDIVLLAIELPDSNGTVLCRSLAEVCSSTAVVVLTAYLDRTLVDICLRAGARGYLLKDSQHLHLREHLHNVAAGHTALDPRVGDMLVEHYRNSPSPIDALSERERQVTELIGHGLTNREIGRRLHLSEYTVKGYVARVFEKLATHSRVEAALIAKRHGLVCL